MFSMLRFLLCISYTFLSLSAVLLVLHCFYDSAFCYSKKKSIVFLVVSILDAVLLRVFGGWGAISWVVLPIAAIYDYQGKKIIGFIRYALLFWLATTWVNGVSRFGFCLMFPEQNREFLFPIVFFFDGYKNELMSATSIQEIQELQNELQMHLSKSEVSDFMMPFNFTIGIVFFGFVSIYVYYRLCRHGIVMRFGKGELIFTFSYPMLCSLVGIAFVRFGLDSEITLITLSVLSILLALFFPLFICNTRISEHYRNRAALQENHMQAELAHFTQYKQSQEETARFRHDIRNHLLCLNNLLVSEKTEEATKYLQDLLFTAEELRQKYVSGDEMLDCIISVKANEMERQNIRFTLDGVLAGGLNWKPMDICNVFANALDNAIEACQKVAPEKRSVAMTIKSTPQFWLISIENSVAEAVDTSKLFQKNGGYTSKSDSAKHGIGTYNMKHTVESCGAMLKAECTGEAFVLEIIINKSSPE